MRFLVAALVFILAISLLLLGLAQRTIWAAPDKFTVNLAISSEHPYLVIPAKELALMPGEPTVSALGDSNVFLALGRENDVISWVGPASHSASETSEDGLALGVREVVGTSDFADPAGSDLWVSETTAEGFAEIQVPSESELAVLVATNGFDPAPNRVRLSWPIATSTVVSDIFLSVGFGFLLIAIILNLLALRKMLINRGPRRKLPKAPQGPKYRPKKAPLNIPKRGRRSARAKIALVPIGIALTFSLSGCAAEPIPIVSPTPTETQTEEPVEVTPPVLNTVQVQKILSDLQEVVASADEARNASLLEKRVTGPSLLLRKAHYELMSKSPDVAPLPAISVSAISITLPASTKTWPRSVMIVTQGDGEEAPQMLVLQQQSPREQYMLWYNIPLLPGSEIPAVASSDVGAIPVEEDSLFLQMQPMQLPSAFGDIIDNGQESEFFGLFDLEGDEYYEQISTTQKEQSERLRRATITFTHELGDQNVISLSTKDSGALVAVLMTDNYEIKPARNSAVTVTGNERLLLGVEGTIKGLRTKYGGMLLFYVPAAGSEDKIVLLGAIQSLLSIKVF
jgi:hypothetical protein